MLFPVYGTNHTAFSLVLHRQGSVAARLTFRVTSLLPLVGRSHTKCLTLYRWARRSSSGARMHNPRLPPRPLASMSKVAARSLALNEARRTLPSRPLLRCFPSPVRDGHDEFGRRGIAGRAIVKFSARHAPGWEGRLGALRVVWSYLLTPLPLGEAPGPRCWGPTIAWRRACWPPESLCPPASTSVLV